MDQQETSLGGHLTLTRRAFITALSAPALAGPLATRAQSKAMPVIGFLAVRSATELAHLVAAFRQGLEEAGYVEGRDVVIEYRWAERQYNRLPALAADLAGRQVVVIAATGGGASALAAKAATSTIPIVFVIGDLDPVKSGLVASLNRPGGNITGIAPSSSFLGPKRVELLHELVPGAPVIGMLVNPNWVDAETQATEAQAAARTLGLQLQIVNAASEAEFDPAFSTLAKFHCGAVVVANDGFLLDHREQVVTLAARYAMPAVYAYREYVAAGGLMSYAPSLADGYRQAGIYTGRIVRGDAPADLPVMLPTKFELVINLKTANALGLPVPSLILARVDEVIE